MSRIKKRGLAAAGAALGVAALTLVPTAAQASAGGCGADFRNAAVQVLDQSGTPVAGEPVAVAGNLVDRAPGGASYAENPFAEAQEAGWGEHAAYREATGMAKPRIWMEPLFNAFSEGSYGETTVQTDANGEATVRLVDRASCAPSYTDTMRWNAPAAEIVVDGVTHAETIGETLQVVIDR